MAERRPHNFAGILDEEENCLTTHREVREDLKSSHLPKFETGESYFAFSVIVT
jgi:hypothetical protein